MSNPKVPGGNDSSSGGASEENPKNQTEVTDSSSAETVSYETHRKLLSEKKKLQERLDQIESDSKAKAQKELEAKEEYKKLYEQAKSEIDEWKGKHTQLDSSLKESLKLRNFLDAVGGEVPKQYWGLIDLDKIAVDPESGQPDAMSVQKAVKEFETQFSEVIRKPGTGKLPNDAAKGASAKLTYNDWLALPDKEKPARMKDVDKSTL